MEAALTRTDSIITSCEGRVPLRVPTHARARQPACVFACACLDPLAKACVHACVRAPAHAFAHA